MNINPIGVATSLSLGKSAQSQPTVPTFKANYALALNEGKSLIKKDVTVSGLKKVLSYIKNKFFPSKAVPQVEQALLAYFSGLQTKKEFLDEFARKSMTGEYMDSNTIHTANIIKKLDNIRVTKSWEFPDYKVMFNNGTLTESAYSEIREKIKDANTYQLTDVAKRDILNDLARSNYHPSDVTFDLNFKGNAEDIMVDSDDLASTLSDNHDGGIWEDILDILDDIL